MHKSLNEFIQNVGFALDVLGVLLIVVGFLLASVAIVYRYFQRDPKGLRGHDLYRDYRQRLARAILIGLEFLVAGDIIRTVSGDLTLIGVTTLGGIVLIRIVLGMTLEAEINPSKKSLKSRLGV
ncbi:hypothetical protein CSA80_00005 [Candidatus Saccharibacteria bacterium]|nr:MAG: hypothetical protein CR973_00930 [Candidatus Saccharibacteria bacterium]PID99669.1 MAG: hypothetical protein CSA80_00005 [Candidatus Saccharibacteria bacterium]